ncbi:hypothetical protein PAP_06300 [Palaeococcus pacificus DY20341]|uniref:DUF3303 domain-containing protein n=1 Tax=Palaeococcus pacificus DY20341 TaxID=1343739 RepID=A0A075LYK7_9EURY|nr:hypothetical protein [Palaeococcus pacificus]AIF69658.1 hypothetical protein PAP_06300 [Palaeococcus pacificus DY20341]
MPMYLITHRWPEEKTLDAMKEAAEFFSNLTKLPEGIEFLASYNTNFGAYTMWKAPNKEALEKIMENFPIFKKEAEITEIVQSYPPTVEYTVRMWKMMLSLAEK